MRRLTLFVIALAMAVSAIAKDPEKDISMVSYEQRWLDSEGTLALKNNTNEEIHTIMFQITYMDMSGKALDYEEFTKSVSIAPGMTKKIDIPAYEHDRHYHYYTSENMPGGSPSFKIEYKLIDYNFTEEETKDDDYDPYSRYVNYDYGPTDHSIDWFWIVAIIVAALFGIGFTVGMYLLVAFMAQQRHRSVIGWMIVSMIGSPLLAIIILLFIGDDNNDVL